MLSSDGPDERREDNTHAEEDWTDVVGQTIRAGQRVLYAGYSSNELRVATVVAMRVRDGRARILVRLDNGRNTVCMFHYPRRIYVLPQTEQSPSPAKEGEN